MKHGVCLRGDGGGRCSSVRVATERSGDRLGRAVRHRQRAKHCPYHVLDAGLRGARTAADLARQNDRRHHTLPRPLHSGTFRILPSFTYAFLKTASGCRPKYFQTSSPRICLTDE